MTDDSAATPDPRALRRARWMVIAIVMAAFTPYFGVGLNIRWEHLIVYGLFVLVGLGHLAGRPIRLDGLSIRLLTAWLLLGLFTVVNTFFRARAAQSAVDPLAALDSFLLPVAIFLIGFTVAHSPAVDPRVLLRTAATTIVIMLCLNSVLILVYDVDEITGILRNFWSNPATTDLGRSVAEMALLGDRYGGIFNQPFDGGVAYTIGVIAWLYLYRSTPTLRLRNLFLLLAGLTLLIAGGVSTQSKAFPYGILLVVALTVLSTAGSLTRARGAIRPLTTGVIAILFAGWLGLVESFDRTINIVFAIREDPDQRYSGISGITGGRTESVGDYLDQLWQALSLSGRGWFGPQDDALISYVNGAGIIGLALFAILIVNLIRVTRAQLRESPERLLALCLVTFMVLASFGAISLQVNRGSSMFWLLMGITASNGTKSNQWSKTTHQSIRTELSSTA